LNAHSNCDQVLRADHVRAAEGLAHVAEVRTEQHHQHHEHRGGGHGLLARLPACGVEDPQSGDA
jgi:hypothetical protein